MLPSVLIHSCPRLQSSQWPLAWHRLLGFGVWNVGAILVFLVAFRHVGFPLFAKLALARPLDTHLDQPLAAFAAVTAGVFAYCSAFMVVNTY